MELIDFLAKYWHIILTLVGLVLSYANLKAQNIEQEKRIGALEVELKIVNGTHAKIEIALAEIQLDLKWIKQSLNNK